MQTGSGRGKLVAIFMAGVTFGVLSSITVAPHIQRESLVTQAGPAGGNVDTGAPGTTPGETGTDRPVAGKPLVGDGGNPEPEGLECKLGKNGGATATGVTATSIKLATTTVQTGPGSAFLGEVKYAMEAVRNKVNAAGGICGRRLEIKYVDDGWDSARGSQYLRNFIKEGVFAIPVAPSSEGLRVVIDAGDIATAGMPVVGTDGMLIDQYTNPWVWPVAVATASSARIMARDAFKRGARKFSIVFDRNYRFGAEAAEAFQAEVLALTKQPIEGYNKEHNCQKAFCGVLAAQASYSTEVQEFSKYKGDFVAMFLEPTTALTWMSTVGVPQASGDSAPRFGIGGAQPLFTYDFASSCQTACDQMQVWTSYKPPIEDYARDPAVKQFVDDLQRTNPNADVNNAFSLGGYIGMTLMVKALQDVGPFLTRQGLKAALTKLTFSSGLTLQPSLSWPLPGQHFANRTMQAFTIQNKGTFNGWRAAQIVREK